MTRHHVVLFLVAGLLTMAGCFGGVRSNKNSKSPASTRSKNATIIADPNPIHVCDGSGLGVSKLTWTALGPAKVEVHVNSPSGDLFARTGANGTATTAKWVTSGMTFYLQDVSGGRPLTSDNTLATVTLGVTPEGCQ